MSGSLLPYAYGATTTSFIDFLVKILSYTRNAVCFWTGHIIGMEDDRIPKRGKRPVAKPRNSWDDDVQKDGVSLLHIRNLKTVAQNK
jgi:hypothetical protein